MKKIVSIILASALTALLLSACTMGKCDICGKSGFVKERTILGTSINVCSDCGG